MSMAGSGVDDIAGIGEMSPSWSASTMVETVVRVFGIVLCCVSIEFGPVAILLRSSGTCMRTIEVAGTDMIWPVLHFFHILVPESTSMSLSGWTCTAF